MTPASGQAIDSTPRVFFFLSSVDGAGITAYSDNSVRGLKQIGVDGRLIIYHDESTPYLVKAPRRIDPSSEFAVVRYDSRDRSDVSVSQLMNELALRAGDVLVGDGWRLLPHIVARSPHPQVHIQVFHGSLECNFSNAPFVLPTCAAFLCVSSSVKSDLAAYCSRHRLTAPPIVVSEPGIPIEKSAVFRVTGKGGPVKIAYSGRVTENPKRCSDVIKILGELRNSLCDFELHVIGSGDGLEPMRELAAKSGVARVCHFHGWRKRETLFSILSECDILISTSSSEGFSTAILEAMALGLTPIVTAVGGAADCVVDGENGFLFPTGDIKAAAARLRGLAADRNSLNSLRQSAVTTVRERFTLEASARRLAAMLFEIRESVHSGAFQPTPISGPVGILDRRYVPNWAVRMVRRLRRRWNGKPKDLGETRPQAVQTIVIPVK